MHKQVSLFEYLGLADQERIHTQTLAWLLNPDVSPIKASLPDVYKKLFEVEYAEGDIPKVVTEYKHIDLYIIADNFEIAVENKLKSSLGDKQLARYDQQLDVGAKKFVLTFSGETSNHTSWVSKDYSHICNVFEAVSSTDHYFNDYRLLLRKLINAREFFLESMNSNPSLVGEIFNICGMRVSERISTPVFSDNESVNFIYKNKLERLFVEIYFRKLLSQLKLSNVDAIVGETRGKALIDIRFNDLVIDGLDNHKLRAGFQIQDKVFKYTIVGDDYHDCPTLKFNDVFTPELIKKLNAPNFRDGFRSNVGKKPYFSFTRKFKNQLNETTYNDLFKMVESQIKECRKFWEDFLATES